MTNISHNENLREHLARLGAQAERSSRHELLPAVLLSCSAICIIVLGQLRRVVLSIRRLWRTRCMITYRKAALNSTWYHRNYALEGGKQGLFADTPSTVL